MTYRSSQGSPDLVGNPVAERWDGHAIDKLTQAEADAFWQAISE